MPIFAWLPKAEARQVPTRPPAALVARFCRYGGMALTIAIVLGMAFGTRARDKT